MSVGRLWIMWSYIRTNPALPHTFWHSPITENWRGRPLVSREAVVNLIGNTTTKGGLEIQAGLDEGSYPTGREVTEDQMARIAIERDMFHGEWNYTVSPRR